MGDFKVAAGDEERIDWMVSSIYSRERLEGGIHPLDSEILQ